MSEGSVYLVLTVAVAALFFLTIFGLAAMPFRGTVHVGVVASAYCTQAFLAHSTVTVVNRTSSWTSTYPVGFETCQDFSANLGKVVTIRQNRDGSLHNYTFGGEP